MMLKKMASTVVMGAMLIAQGLAQKTEPQPSWVLDQTGYHCAIAGKVGGAVPATLVVRTFVGTREYAVLLTTDRLPARVRTARKQGQFALGTGKFERAPAWALDKDGKAIHMKGLPAELIESFAQASELNLAADGKPAATYALVSTGAAAQALAKCEADKLIEAGADPTGFEPGATRARPISNTDDWIDLPVRLGPSTRHFYAALLLDVGSDGRVAGCELIEGTRNFNAESMCKTLQQRARYEPARNGKGQPVRTVTVYEQGITLVDAIVTTVM